MALAELNVTRGPPAPLTASGLGRTPPGNVEESAWPPVTENLRHRSVIGSVIR